MQARVLRFRVINLVGAVLAVAYNAVAGIWPFVAMNLAITVINTYWLTRMVRERHDEAVYRVVEVDEADGWLRHVLAVHASDIAEFFPDYAPAAPGAARRHAFVVAHGDETVGVVVFSDAGNGAGAGAGAAGAGDSDAAATIELDWVTPRFRDFTPGEFVHRRSGIFLDSGYRRVVVPRDFAGAGSYLPRVGFRRDGDGWVRDLAA